MSEPISISKEIANKTFSSNAYPPVHKFQSEVNFTDLDNPNLCYKSQYQKPHL